MEALGINVLMFVDDVYYQYREWTIAQQFRKTDRSSSARMFSTGHIFQFVAAGRSRVGGSGRESRMIGKSHYIVWMMNSVEAEGTRAL